MRSGIKPNSEICQKFLKLKLDRTLKCMIFGFTENNEIEIIYEGDNQHSYKDLFVDPTTLPDNKPRIIVYDFDYETNENPPRKTNKLILIYWCPQRTPIQKKFTYTASINEIANTFGGIQKIIQVDCANDMSYEVIRSECLRP